MSCPPARSGRLGDVLNNRCQAEEPEVGCAPARSCSCGMEEPEPEQIRLKCVRKGGHFTVPPDHRVRRAGRPGWGIGGLGEVEGGRRGLLGRRRGLGVPLSGGWADPGGGGQMHPREGTDPPRAPKERVFRAGAPPLCPYGPPTPSVQTRLWAGGGCCRGKGPPACAACSRRAAHLGP